MRLVVALSCFVVASGAARAAAPAPASAPTAAGPTAAPSTTGTPTTGSSTVDTAQDAAKTEEAAFAAIESEQWCLAMRLFEQAHLQGPAVDLLMNASQAGEYGGDFGAALRFADEVAGLASAPKPKKTEAKKRASVLAKQIAKSGAGTPCASLEELQPKPVLAAVPTPTPTPTPAALPPTEAAPMDLRSFGFIGAGIGGAALVVGGATAGVGLVPWFAHAGALEKIEAAEADKGDAATLQQEQAAAREGWESYGQALTVAGVVVAGVGLTAVVAGLGFGLLSPAPAE